VAAYHPWVYLKGGIERLLFELITHSRHEWILYTHHFDPGSTFPEMKDLNVVQLAPRISVRRSLRPLIRASRIMMTTQLPDDGARALLVSSDGMGDLLMVRNRLPAACYLHTPLKILHDPVTRETLAKESKMKSIGLSLLAPAFQIATRRAWRRYGHVFVNSEETRARVTRAKLVPNGPVEVLHPGVDADRYAFKPGPRQPFFLVPGRMMWQKNIELAIDAFARAHGTDMQGELVIAGMVDEKSRPYLASLRARASELPIRFVVDPSDARMIELYQACTAVIFPPSSEDFGIVPLEAMAAGAPVLAVDAAGPRETIRSGETGWLLPPFPDAFADKMREVAAAGPALEPVRRAARQRALAFSWRTFADRVDHVMEDMARSK